MAAVLKSTGGAAGLTQAALNDMASALQNVSTYDDDAITGAQTILLQFDKIGKETFPRASKAVVDLAARMGTDLAGAATLLGKALQDPETGLKGLRGAGVSLDDAEKELIKSLVETGNVAQAQAIVLGELERSVGGAAAATRDTLGGALEAAKVAFGNLLEGDSGSDGIRGSVGAINNLTDTMNSPETKAGFASMIDGLAGVAKFALEGIAALNGNTEAARQNSLANAQKSYIGLLQRRFELEDLLGKNFIQRPVGDAFRSDTSIKAELANVGKLEAAYR